MVAEGLWAVRILGRAEVGEGWGDCGRARCFILASPSSSTSQLYSPFTPISSPHEDAHRAPRKAARCRNLALALHASIHLSRTPFCPTLIASASPFRMPPTPSPPPPPELTFLYTLHCRVAPALYTAAVPHGTRRVYPIKGGHFAGPRLEGTVLDFGADWVRASSSAHARSRNTPLPD